MFAQVVKEYIKKIVDRKESLNGEEVSQCIRAFMNGEASEGQIGAFLIAMKSVALEPEVKKLEPWHLWLTHPGARCYTDVLLRWLKLPCLATYRDQVIEWTLWALVETAWIREHQWPLHCFNNLLILLSHRYNISTAAGFVVAAVSVSHKPLGYNTFLDLGNLSLPSHM